MLQVDDYVRTWFMLEAAKRRARRLAAAFWLACGLLSIETVILIALLWR